MEKDRDKGRVGEEREEAINQEMKEAWKQEGGLTSDFFGKPRLI